jgi:peroxiredoxin
VLRGLGRADTDLYGPLRDWMASADLAPNALKVGDAAPEFFLPDETARLVSLGDLLAKGPVVVSFLGGSWCSFCVSKARALAQAARGHPASVVAISPETGRYPRTMKAQGQLDCVVLSDVDYGVGLQFGLLFAVPPEIVRQMAVRGLDLIAMHGVAKPMLAAPAVYVIGTSGRITWARIDLDYTVGVDVAPVLEALARG